MGKAIIGSASYKTLNSVSVLTVRSSAAAFAIFFACAHTQTQTHSIGEFIIFLRKKQKQNPIRRVFICDYFCKWGFCCGGREGMGEPGPGVPLSITFRRGKAICSKRCCALLDCAWNPRGIIQHRFSLCFAVSAWSNFILSVKRQPLIPTIYTNSKMHYFLRWLPNQKECICTYLCLCLCVRAHVAHAHTHK